MDDEAVGRMTDEVGETLTDIRDALSDIRRTSERRAMPPMSQAHIEINGGGIGVIVASASAALALGVLVASSVFYTARISDLQDQINRNEDYVQAIYMMAPHLKPKEEK